MREATPMTEFGSKHISTRNAPGGKAKMTHPSGLRDNAGLLTLYGFSHGATDAVCAAVVLSGVNLGQLAAWDAYYWVLTYNVLAFGLQPFFGRLTDALRNPRGSALAGCILVGASAPVVGVSVILAVILAGLGNALFHVGGGTVSLSISPGRASAPGLFVAPGALGLLVGGLTAYAGWFTPWPFVAVMGVCAIGIASARIPDVDYQRRQGQARDAVVVTIIVLLLFAVGIRAFIGLSAVFPWKTGTALPVALVLAIVAGKALGGVIADRFGWRFIAVGAVVISAPLLAFGSHIAWTAILAAGIFNFTMAVTLTAVATVLPGRPGLAFGLPCLALLGGAAAAQTDVKTYSQEPLYFLAVTLLAAGAIWAALTLLYGVRPLLSRKGPKHAPESGDASSTATRTAGGAPDLPDYARPAS
jgi:FSR family fosmidomycin resistance protein-like MFS transporter